MLKTSFITILITSKSLNNMINKFEIDNESDNKDKAKSLFIFSAFLKKRTEANYFTFNTKKTINFL